MSNSWLARLAPTPLALVIYTILALALFFIGTYGNWIDFVVDPSIRANIFDQIGSSSRELLAMLLDTAGPTATVVSFLFWLVVGSVVYTLVWTATVFIKDIINEIEVSLVFVHPRSFTESKHWYGYLTHFLLRAAVAMVLIGYSALAVFALWPAIITQVSYGLLVFSWQSLLTQIAPAFLLAILTMHIFVLLFQLLLWRRSADYWLKWTRQN